MGSINTKDMKAILDEMPPTPPSEKRVLTGELDPRSPTVGITRTPIQVDKSPEAMFRGRPPCVGVSETPTHADQVPDDLFDPRSPSVGITRTPIQLDKVADTLFDPRSPSVGITRTPIYTKHNSKQASDVVSARPHSVIGNPSFDILSHDATAELARQFEDSMELMTRSSSEPDLNKDNVQLIRPNPVKTPVADPTVRKSKPKALFQIHSDEVTASPRSTKVKDATRSPLRLLGDKAQRSPMSKRKVDYNSPRVMVQRKQVNKLSQLKGRVITPIRSAGTSPCKYEVLHDDKENVSI